MRGKKNITMPSFLEYLDNDATELVGFLAEYAICDDIFTSEHEYNKYDVTSHIISFMKKNSRRNWFEAQSSTWNQKFSPKFSEVITSRGMGFSFNLKNASEVIISKE